MYYSYPCSYCSKIFCTFDDYKEAAANKLFYGIKQHLISYGEDSKEHEFDDDPKVDANRIYSAMIESNTRPVNGYEV